MSERTKLNNIIKKLYARELDLIESVPAYRVKRRSPLALLNNMVWARQSAAVKVAIASLLLAIVSAGVFYYNSFIENAYKAKMEMAQIEVQLQRRNDLIPNLVAAVTHYMVYEQNIFMHAADVRTAVKSLEETVKTQGLLPANESVLSKFQAVAEAYPALKASDSYQILMKELSDTETKIAQMRTSYNTVANYYNSRLRMFPGNMFNLVFRFPPMPAFESEAAAKSAPRVK